MDNEQIMELLQAAYLSLSGFTEGEMLNKHEVKKIFARAGIKLCAYLKSIKLNHEDKK